MGNQRRTEREKQAIREALLQAGVSEEEIAAFLDEGPVPGRGQLDSPTGEGPPIVLLQGDPFIRGELFRLGIVIRPDQDLLFVLGELEDKILLGLEQRDFIRMPSSIRVLTDEDFLARTLREFEIDVPADADLATIVGKQDREFVAGLEGANLIGRENFLERRTRLQEEAVAGEKPAAPLKSAPIISTQMRQALEAVGRTPEQIEAFIREVEERGVATRAAETAAAEEAAAAAAAALPKEEPAALRLFTYEEAWRSFVQRHRSEIRRVPGMWDWVTQRVFEGSDRIARAVDLFSDQAVFIKNEQTINTDATLADLTDILEDQIGLDALKESYGATLAEAGLTEQQFITLTGAGIEAFLRGLSADIFTAEWEKLKLPLLKDLPPSLAAFLDSTSGQDAVRSRYIRLQASLRDFDVRDPGDEEALPISTEVFVRNLEERELFAMWANAEPTGGPDDLPPAFTAWAGRILEGLPPDVVRSLGPVLANMMDRDFGDQSARVGGTRNIGSFMVNWRPDRIELNRTVLFIFPDLGMRLGITAAISEAGGDSLQALMLATDTFKEATGREPTMEEVFAQAAETGFEAPSLQGFPASFRGAFLGDPLTSVTGGGLSGPLVRTSFQDAQRQSAKRKENERISELEGQLGIATGSGFDIRVLETELLRQQTRKVRDQTLSSSRRPFGSPVLRATPGR
jgi:hypothetical protein